VVYHRLSTGVAGLDPLLGGGLLPGTLVVVVGATGIGKTQLGLQFAHAGRGQEGRRGILFDMACRGDAQHHAAYAQRMFHWTLRPAAVENPPRLDGFFDPHRDHGDYLHVFDLHGRRVARSDVDEDTWRLWQSELLARLSATIAFFYGNFTQGVRRAVVDGIEPVDRAADSIQWQLLDYVYHQIVRKDPQWVARDLFRQHFRQHAHAVAQRTYDPRHLVCVVLCTSRETMLDDLISRPIEEGDLLAGANTLIYLGKQREGRRLGRALYIAKHRGSACCEEIVPYTIDDRGLRIG
jgi:KaiC/GvpD/RAD55 family RecA-like ATPase